MRCSSIHSSETPKPEPLFPVVSSKIFSPQRFRRIDQRVDDTEMRFAFILVHPYPLTGHFSPERISAFTDNFFMRGEGGGCSPPCSPDSPFTYECRIHTMLCFPYNFVAPPRDSGPILYKFQGFATVRIMHLISVFGRRGGNPTADMEGGSHDHMVNFDRRGDRCCYCHRDPIIDPKEKLLLGLVLWVLHSFTMRDG